jgi:uncharacterized membrane protein
MIEPKHHQPLEEIKPVSFHMSLLARLRAYLFAGILLTAPIAITIYIVWLVVTFVDHSVANALPPTYNPNLYLPFSVPGLGLILVTAFLIVVGWLAAGMLGRFFVRISEGVLNRMPVVRSVYSAVKQIFETILAERANAFSKVVLIQFPRQGMWRIGFVTGMIPGNVQDVSPGGVVNVFVPNSPNVTAGFLVLVPLHEIVEVDLTPEEGLKLIVSGGIAGRVVPAPGTHKAAPPPK